MTIDLYPPIIHAGDLTPDAAGSKVDSICEQIHKACKGFGTDEKKLLQALGNTTPELRCSIPVRYEELYGGKKLQDVIKSECGNRQFGTTLQFLAVDPVEAECDMIDYACKGFGTSETLLLSILCGRTNKEIDILKKKYFKLKTKDLGSFVDSELSGVLEFLTVNVLQGIEEGYDPEYHDQAKIEADASKLYKMGQGKWGTDEKGLFKIICSAPPKYLKDLNLYYADKYGYTLVKVLEKELAGASEKAAMFMIGMKLKPYEEIAKLINTACAGFGTNEILFSATLIRYQSVLKEVSTAHVALYGKTIRDRIKSELSGDLEKVLLEVLDAAGDV